MLKVGFFVFIGDKWFISSNFYTFKLSLGHSPSEAFNETVEEATQSLYPLIGANGKITHYTHYVLYIIPSLILAPLLTSKNT